MNWILALYGISRINSKLNHSKMRSTVQELWASLLLQNPFACSLFPTPLFFNFWPLVIPLLSFPSFLPLCIVIHLIPASPGCVACYQRSTKNKGEIFCLLSVMQMQFQGRFFLNLETICSVFMGCLKTSPLSRTCGTVPQALLPLSSTINSTSSIWAGFIPLPPKTEL